MLTSTAALLLAAGAVAAGELQRPGTAPASATPETAVHLEEPRSSRALDALPEYVLLHQDETLALPLPPGATAFDNCDRCLVSRRTATGIELTGVEPARSFLFLTDGGAARVLTVQVVWREYQPVVGPVAPPPPAPISTHGWVKNGSVELGQLRAAGLTYSTQAFHLNGSNDTAVYGLNVYGYNVNGVVARLDGNLTVAGHGAHLDVGSGYSPTELRPVATLTRSASAGFTAGPLELEVGARGGSVPLQDVQPEAYRARGALHLGPAWLDAGVLASAPGARQEVVPFAGLGLGTTRVSLSAEGGLFTDPVTGRKQMLYGATAHARTAECEASAGYSSGAADASDALSLYVARVPHSVATSGRCRLGRVWASAGARRGEELLGGDPTETLGTLELAYGGERFDAHAGGTWTADGRPDIRNFATASSGLQLGDFHVALATSATQPQAQIALDHRLMVQRRFDGASLGATAGVVQQIGQGVQLVQGALTGQASSERFSAGFELSTLYDVARRGVATALVLGRLGWTPARAYAVSVSGQTDVQNRAAWTVFGTFSWSFGDDLPAEPLLSPFRSSSIRVLAFLDKNGNGVRDPGEPPLEGVDVCDQRGRCGATGADGTWLVGNEPAGEQEIVARTPRFPGAVPTTPVVARVMVGEFGSSEADFGFTLEGVIAVHAYLDDDVNGERGPDEKDFTACRAHVSGPGVDRTIALSELSEVPWSERGTFHVELDRASLPPGYVALKGVTVEADAFRRFDVELAVTPVRSIDGRVCIDANGDGVCQRDELRVGLARVRIDGHTAKTDSNGNFLLSLLPAGRYDIAVMEEDLPPGTVPAKPLVVVLGADPQAVSNLVVALKPSIAARRSTAVEVSWDGGRARAVELGGYTLLGATVRGGAPSKTDAAALQHLSRLVAEPDTRVVVTAYQDPEVEEGVQRAAKAKAERTAATIADWLAGTLRIARSRVATEAFPATGQAMLVEVRVYQRVK